MALTGMQIYKLLPKTNCKDCGVPTCLAFAMKVANKKASILECPHASDEAKEKLAVASEPPVREITLKLGREDRKIGNETVKYRHEKTFYNPTVMALQLSDNLPESDVRLKAEKVKNWTLERIGMILEPEALYLRNDSGDKDKFMSLVKTAYEVCPDKAFMFHSDRVENLEAVSKMADEMGIRNPVYGFATKDNYRDLVEMAKKTKGSIILKADDLDQTYELTTELRFQGFKDVILAVGGEKAETSEKLRNNVIIRRSAVRKNIKEMGFPIINYLANTGDVYEAAFDGAVSVCKYASILVLDDPDETPTALLTALLLLRQNIYTDPQKPIQVEAKIYELGEVTSKTPVMVTTNFSLTYFLVAGEIETTGYPTYLAVVDAEGMGVLTAWAADKFNGEIIAEFINKSGIGDKVEEKRLVIPGYLANIKGETEDALPGWEIMVGPTEATGLPVYMKTILNQ